MLRKAGEKSVDYIAFKRKESSLKGEESPSVDYIAFKRKESSLKGEESPSEGEEIPRGWNVKSEVQNDGSIKMVLKNLL